MGNPVADALLAVLREPTKLVTDPSERAYWLFLVGGVIIGAAVLLWRLRSIRTAARALTSARVWLHASALMDYRLVVVKALIQVLLLAPLALSALGVAVAVVSAFTSAFGDPGASSLSRFQIMAIYTVVLFVAWDFSRYLVHRLLHRVPALWEFHKVHHSAEVLTPFTVYRVHPVESLLFGLRGALVTGLVTGVFFYLFRDKALQYELLGVNAVGVVLNGAGANLRHSHVWISYGQWVERVLISPAQHQIHHSVHPEDYDANYGSFLALWDWIGGTLRIARRRPRRFGLSVGQHNHDPHGAVSAVIGPFVALTRRLTAMVRRLLSRGAWEKKHETSAPFTICDRSGDVLLGQRRRRRH